MRPLGAETCAVSGENAGECAWARPELCSVNRAEMGEQQWWVLGGQQRWVLGGQRAHRTVPVLGATARSCSSLALRPAHGAFWEKQI